MKNEIYGLILNGGQSARMGVDKGTIQYYGKPQREYLYDLLQKFCSRVFLSTKNEVASELPAIVDAYDLSSPLNGVLSAFKIYAGVAWLTVPVDMPLIDEDTIRFLLAHRDSNHVATCFFDSDGKNPEPLFTLWESQAHQALLKFYQSEQFSPREFLKQHDVNLIHIPNPRVLTNVNSKEELERFLGGR